MIHTGCSTEPWVYICLGLSSHYCFTDIPQTKNTCLVVLKDGHFSRTTSNCGLDRESSPSKWVEFGRRLVDRHKVQARSHTLSLFLSHRHSLSHQLSQIKTCPPLLCHSSCHPYNDATCVNIKWEEPLLFSVMLHALMYQRSHLARQHERHISLLWVSDPHQHCVRLSSHLLYISQHYNSNLGLHMLFYDSRLTPWLLDCELCLSS